MDSDDAVWYILANQHCAYKAKTNTVNFCRNKYNVSGLCNRSSCPLANSLYATVLEHGGVCYLYKKTAERLHTPKYMWERVQLKNNYQAALQQIDEHLKYWPQFLVHKNKQRLTKIKQYLVRMRKLGKKTQQRIVTAPRKQEKRETRREQKAEVAARVEKSIESELLKRLQDGTYNDIYNFPSKQYEDALNSTNATSDTETIHDDELDLEEEEEEDNENEPEVEYVEDLGEHEDELQENGDLEDAGDAFERPHVPFSSANDDDNDSGAGAQGKKKRKRRRQHHIELEYEDAQPANKSKVLAK